MNVKTTHPFFKGPALADFMFVVVKYLLARFDHLMSHVLDLCDSLEKKQTIMCHRITAYSISSDVQTAYSATEVLHHHELERN